MLTQDNLAYLALPCDKLKAFAKLWAYCLRNRTLHAYLYAKKNTCFDHYFLDAMDIDDNLRYASSLKERGPREKSVLESNSVTSMELNVEKIVDMVLNKMGHVFPTS